ncbi:peptidylprolyl isomerase [Bacteroidia bacterium]|nr:peptidylprolyl isomerase [Bacteroidia bacterium]
MAVLETLRTKAGVLLAVVIGIALLSFVAGDLFGVKRGRGGLFSSDDVGEINGHGISREDYTDKVDYYTEIYRIMYNQSNHSEAMTDEIREQAWFAFVQQYAVQPEWEHLGLRVSSDELFDLIQGKNPSQLVIRNFSNPNTGEFDRVAVLQYLQNIDANPNPDAKTYWLFLEREIVNQRIQEKLLSLVSKSLYTTTLEAQEAVNGSSNNVDIEYVVRNISGVADSAVTMSSGDIKKYYNLNKKRYKQTQSCDVEYITLAIVPSPEDNTAVKEWIERLSPQFSDSEDPRLFVAQHSDVAFDEKYHKKSELQGAIADFAFEKNKTDFLPPFEEDGVYKMARIADIRDLPDSVQARHILLSTRESMDATRKVADSIKTALKRGANFKELADKYSVDKTANEKGGDLGWFAHNAMVKPFGDSCFFATKGKIMIVETRFGVHVVQVTDKGKAEKKVQVAVVSREVTPSKITRTQLFSQVNDIATQSKNRQAFLDAIAEKGFVPRSAPRITINDKNIQGLQGARELIRWAWNAKKNEVSPIFEIDNNFVIATLTQHRKDGFAAIEQVRTEIASTLLQQKKGEWLLQEVEGMDVAAASSQFNLTPQTATGINYASFYIPNVGVEPKLAASASATAEGQTAAVAGSTGVYVYKVTAANTNVTEDAVAAEKSRSQQMAVQRAGYEVLNVLRNESEIKDYRGETMF